MAASFGTEQIITHDGDGGLGIESRPFVLIEERAALELGGWSPS